MKLIEISHNFYLNSSAVCSIKVSTSEKMESADIGGKMRSSPKKVGEETSISILTSDGKDHQVDQKFVQEVHDFLFPTEE